MDRGHTYTFGIEEEFFLVDLRTRNAMARMPRRLVKLCRGRLGEAVTWELKQAQIETATPVLADVVSPAAPNLDPTDVERRITPHTRAVIAVHMCGYPTDMAALEELCAARGCT